MYAGIFHILAVPVYIYIYIYTHTHIHAEQIHNFRAKETGKAKRYAEAH